MKQNTKTTADQGASLSPYCFSRANYEAGGLLPVPAESIGRHAEFVQKIRARPSVLFRSAIESIDAAVALLALGQVSQSYLLFTQAAEVSLKAVLDEVKRMGLASWGAANPGFMRRLAAMKSVSPPGSVKDSTFIGAFREVGEFADFSDNVRSAVPRINSARNEIAHRGGEPADTSRSPQLRAPIAACAFPKVTLTSLEFITA